MAETTNVIMAVAKIVNGVTQVVKKVNALAIGISYLCVVHVIKF